VVRIVLAQPTAARFLVRKLYHFLVSENVEPPASFLEPLADAFRKSDYDIAGLLRTILSSRHFFSAHAFRQRIKSPVEYVMGAVQAVYRPYMEGEADYRPLPQQSLVGWVGAMGQSLFAPPNVKGWAGGRTWLNTSTVLERDNFATALAMGALWTGVASRPDDGPVTPPRPSAGDALEHAAPPRAFDPVRLLREEKATGPDEIVRVLLDFYVPGGIRPEAQSRLVAFLSEGKPTGAALDHRAREVVQGIMTMAEYQLA